MMQTLASFAALSMAGTVLLSLLPDGGLRRTAAMVIGLMTLMCWAEDILALFGQALPVGTASGALTSTSLTLEHAEQDALSAVSARWEASP